MDRNLEKSNVVPSTTLENQEGYVVGTDGIKTAAAGDFVYGVVSRGRPANEASEVIVGGETDAKVNGGSTAISTEDPLTGGAGGKFIKATIGTDMVRAIAKEAVSSDTEATVMLL